MAQHGEQSRLQELNPSSIDFGIGAAIDAHAVKHLVGPISIVNSFAALGLMEPVGGEEEGLVELEDEVLQLRDVVGEDVVELEVELQAEIVVGEGHLEVLDQDTGVLAGEVDLPQLLASQVLVLEDCLYYVQDREDAPVVVVSLLEVTLQFGQELLVVYELLVVLLVHVVLHHAEHELYLVDVDALHEDLYQDLLDLLDHILVLLETQVDQQTDDLLLVIYITKEEKKSLLVALK